MLGFIGFTLQWMFPDEGVAVKNALVGAVAALIAFLGGLLSGKEPLLLLAVLIILLLIYMQLQASKIHYRKIDRSRWGHLGDIKYGHIQYPPFFYKSMGGHNDGIGLDTLKDLLKNIHLTDAGGAPNWVALLDHLVAGHYDIVATPLFATFERSKRIGFSAPLFYSNVGCFTTKAFADKHSLHGLDEAGLRDKLAACRDSYAYLAMPGEISEKLARKYRNGRGIKLADQGHDPVALFGNVHAADREPLIFFAESFYARQSEAFRQGDVVNILKSHEILYPVCFATRIGDYQLRNLLNIRLLQYARDDSVLEQLARRIVEYDTAEVQRRQLSRSALTIEDVYADFVDRWPYQHLTELS